MTLKIFITIPFTVVFLALSAGSNGTRPEGSDFKIIKFGEFEDMTSKPSSQLRIFNFWATWCAPCVQEMPYFQSISLEDGAVSLSFISMDDARNPERVTGFMQRRNITAPVYLLNEVDFNKWIEKVDPSWSGAIPATLFIKPNGERYFHEGELSETELKSLINQLK